ncbi:E3 ubiquitin-protein ligase RKP, partial [Camellia lanceoleosa]
CKGQFLCMERKWMYEVILETSGIQQLGWATLSCPFTDQKGVGDADDSYAYDGKRVSKWNKEAEPYGQSWVVGDVIGCCIDLDHDQISFYRNGSPLGVAFSGIRKMVPGLGYYPAISLSQGERCDLNFGARPFKYPIKGFLPMQGPPSTSLLTTNLLDCLSRLLEMQRMERTEFSSVEKFRRLKRFVPCEELFYPVSRGICEEFFSALDADVVSIEYIGWGPLLSFIMEVFGGHPPHDYICLDRVLDLLLEFQRSRLMFKHIINALSCGCKIASLVLTECPYSGSYPYLALACHILRREELMALWWKLENFEFLFEGFLSRKSPNRQDLQYLIPSVWWPGSCDDISYESSMMLTTTALSEALSKIEEKHRDLCRLVMQFIPLTTPSQLPGSVFRTFYHILPPPGVSSNSVLVSLFTVILHFLSEGFAMGDISRWMKGCGTNVGPDVGFLHRGGQQSFPISLFLKNDPHRVDICRLGGSFSHLAKSHPVIGDQEAEIIRWEEGCMDDEESKVTHSSRQKPCCCSSYDVNFSSISKNPIRHTTKGLQSHCSSIPESSARVATDYSTGNLNDEITDKPSTSDQSESEFGYRPVHQMRIIPMESYLSAAMLKEEELLDAMLLLYHLGPAPNFKQERACGEQLKRLKEARSVYREEVRDCVRNCAWYRISLFSRWKQRGMYSACMWLVQLLLVASKVDSVFLYIPEFYLETLSDPPFVPTAIFIKQGLAFSDCGFEDLLLQSISVLVQYKEFLAAFEKNEAAIQKMPKALLSAFDNRSWIPVTNILLDSKGSGFGSSKHGESSLSSVVFLRVLREACIHDEELFSAFLNRLFNTLSWAMTEFSVSIREMQEKYKGLEFQQRKCSVIFDLSCNLARLLEFCTREIPQAFLSGADTNLRRLTELIVFILNHITSAEDPEFLKCNKQRPDFSPLTGIILNLLDASVETECSKQNDVVGCLQVWTALQTALCGFQYLLDYNWSGFGVAGSKVGWVDTVVILDPAEDAHLAKLRQLEQLSTLLISQLSQLKLRGRMPGEADVNDITCCICYACEADAQFVPCSHIALFWVHNPHLLNCERCFFCNATAVEVVRLVRGQFR